MDRFFGNFHAVQTLSDYYGLDSQCQKLKEEMAELDEALAVHARLPSAASRQAIVSEMADVLYLIRQVAYKMAIEPEEIEGTIDYKFRRQLMRIEKKERNEPTN